MTGHSIMNNSSSRLWSRTLHAARRAGRDSRARPRRQALGLETLEGRVMLTLTPQMVLDINPTTLSLNPTQLTAVGSLSYFVADDGIHGQELWKSDGTAAGTTLVKDIYPGSGWTGGWYYGYSYQPNSSNPGNLTNVNGTLFFSASDGTSGEELWKS